MNSWWVWTIAAVLVIAPASVMAQGNGSGGSDNASSSEETDDENPKVDVSDDRAEIEYSRDMGDVENDVRIVFERDQASFQVQLDSSAQQQGSDGSNGSGDNGSDDDNATSAGASSPQDSSGTLEAEAVYEYLVEYTDENDNGQYDDGEPVVSGFLLSQGADPARFGPTLSTARWEPLKVEDVSSETGQDGKLIKARAALKGTGPVPLPQDLPVEVPGAGNGTFGFDLYVFGTPTLVNGTTLTGSDVALEVLIDHYPFAQDATQLALLTSTEADEGSSIQAGASADEDGASGSAGSNDSDDSSDEGNETDADHEGLEEQHDLEGLKVTLSHAWKPMASVDGTDEEVHIEEANATESNVTGNETEDAFEKEQKDFVLSYPRADLIVHGGVTGVMLTGLDEGFFDEAFGAPGPGVIAALAAVGLAAFAAAPRVAQSRRR